MTIIRFNGVNIDVEQSIIALDRVDCAESLTKFIQLAWHVLEPSQPYVHNWHIDAIAEHLEAITDSDGLYNRLLINIPPGCMKALDIETPILTTWGWKRHGDLRAGDFVFGPDGTPRRVLAVTPHKIEPVYAVRFDDEAELVAGAGHLWSVERDDPYGAPGGRRCRKPAVVPTPELVPSVAGRALQRPDRIPIADPIEFPERRLLIDPYVLGCWLGDGSTDSALLTVGEEDFEHFKALGPVVTTVLPSDFRKRPSYRIGLPEVQTKLRVLGILKNKHIPDDYLEASVEQRWQLLRGLMDTDGCATVEGNCFYTTKLPHLGRQALTLACSLGLKATLRETWSVLNGVRHGPYHEVRFTPPAGAVVFNLARKQARLNGSTNPRIRGRYVQSVTPISERAVNCICVEGELYLAGDRFVTTHNSLLVNVLWPAWEWGPRGLPHMRWINAAHSQELAVRDANKMRRLITSDWYQARWPDVRLTADQNQKMKFENTATGFRQAAAAGSITGNRADRVIIDDPHSVEGAASDQQRKSTIEWFLEAVPTRMNNPDTSTIVVIMQRLHEEDVSGVILDKQLGYDHLMLPMRFDTTRSFPTKIGFEDPRTEPGELLFPERFPLHVVERDEKIMGPYACTPAESPVLMADLSMRPISEVRPGDQVVGFVKPSCLADDPRGYRRNHLTTAEVKAVHRYVAPVARMTLDSGETLRCTADHKWFTKDRGAARPAYCPAVVGSKLARVCPPRLPELSAEDEHLAGWLSGFFDADGSVSNGYKTDENGVALLDYRPSATISFYQGAGRNLPLCEKLENALGHFGFEFTYDSDWRKEDGRGENEKKGYEYRKYRLTGGGLPVYQRFLHIVRPSKWRDRIVNGAFGAKYITGRERVVAIEPDGVEPVYALETTTGNYVVWGLLSSNSAGQFQQEPAPRGGGVIKREWWQLWPEPVYPPMDFIVASLDTAYTTKSENDFSALTVWGVFSGSRAAYASRWALPGGRLMAQDDQTAMFDEATAVRTMTPVAGGDTPKVVLMLAWAERLELHDLVVKIADTCRKMKVDRLLIENKASGYSVAQEIRRLFGHEDWGVFLLDPKGTDKLARLYSVQHLFADGLIFAPDKAWADMVITQASVFPKGKHDDLVDTVSQALRHVRDIGLLTRPAEWAAEIADSMRVNTHGHSDLPPIYPS